MNNFSGQTEGIDNIMRKLNELRTKFLSFNEKTTSEF